MAALLPLLGSAAAAYAPQIASAVLPSALSAGKKIGNFLFSSKGKKNIGHLLSTAGGVAKILAGSGDTVKKGLNAANVALEVGSKLGIIDPEQARSYGNTLNQGYAEAANAVNQGKQLYDQGRRYYDEYREPQRYAPRRYEEDYDNYNENYDGYSRPMYQPAVYQPRYSERGHQGFQARLGELARYPGMQ